MVTRLSGGLTPADGADPRTFPAIWNTTAGTIEAQGSAIAVAEGDIASQGSAIAVLEGDSIPTNVVSPVSGDSLVYDGTDWVNGPRSGNAVINGDFGVWQRGTTFSNHNAYAADRWDIDHSAAVTVNTVSREAFTPADIEAVGYGDAEFFARFAISSVNGSARASIKQSIEDVRTFAGQEVTLSFWAKADSSRTFQNAFLLQIFGSGGSGVNVVNLSASGWSLTTSWQRFTRIVTLPSLSGETIGSGSSLQLRFDMPLADGATVDLWGVQLEAGSVATPFRLAGGGSKGAELALCQRYYSKSYLQAAPAGTISTNANIAWNAVTTTSNRNYVTVKFPTSMRAVPTVSLYSPITGTLGKAYNALTSAADKNASTNYIGQDTFAAYIGPTDGANAVGDLLLVHYVASAEL